MKMDAKLVDNIKTFLSKFSLNKLLLVSLCVFVLLLVQYAGIRKAVEESRTELIQPNMLYSSSKVQNILKRANKVKTDSGMYRSQTLTMKHNEIMYINKTKYLSEGEKSLKEMGDHGKDVGSVDMKTEYIMHKLENENGHNLFAEQRANLVKERCQIYFKESNLRPISPKARFRFNHEFMVSRSYNLTICYNCKVASTNIKRVLYLLDHNFTGNMKNLTALLVGKYGVERRNSFQQVMYLKHQINVMLVREPLERLLSAFRDKRPYTAKRPRPGHFKNPLFSFMEYLQLILHENHTRNLDRHIYPYFERCRPCEMQYDFVGTPNHFKADTEALLQQIGASGKFAVPERNETGYTSESSDNLLKQYFSKVPNEMIHKLWEKYYKDYYIFGFPYPSHLMH